uniref:histidine kinase n=1 Tax=Panagrolaimus superbus TaxID=310955 RepID=A0A914Y9U9_9BILA
MALATYHDQAVWVCALRDVTAQVELEDTLRRAEQQLLQAKQAAEAAVLAKGEFLATMSHEIRTPLNGILPMLELIARGPLGEDQRQMLATASASSQQLLRIVDDILDYSRLEAQALELEITSFNLRDLLDGVVQLMQRAADAKGLALGLQLDPSPGRRIHHPHLWRHRPGPGHLQAHHRPDARAHRRARHAGPGRDLLVRDPAAEGP